MTIGEDNIVKRVESKLVHVHWNAIIKSITFKPNFKNQFLPCVLSPSPNMFASAEKKTKNQKGKTISLTDSLAGDVGTGEGNTYVSQPVIRADKTDNLERNVSITWHSNDGNANRAPPATILSFPLLHRLLENPILTRVIFQNLHPTFLRNRPCDVTDDPIKKFLRG